jgi:hypothetical protein
MSLIEDLRVRIGLPFDDTSKDAEINAAKDSAFALMGNYCDRIFLDDDGADVEEQFTHRVGKSLNLKRYPIIAITSIVDDKSQAFTAYHEEPDTGVIHLDEHRAFHQVTVTFSGGYDEDALPPDLLMAFYSVFDQEYALGEGGVVSASGEIQSVTVADVGTVRYTTSSSDSSSDSGAFLPDRTKSILEAYMRFKC